MWPEFSWVTASMFAPLAVAKAANMRMTASNFARKASLRYLLGADRPVGPEP